MWYQESICPLRANFLEHLVVSLGHRKGKLSRAHVLSYLREKSVLINFISYEYNDDTY